jgi:hypothetical protein
VVCLTEQQTASFDTNHEKVAMWIVGQLHAVSTGGTGSPWMFQGVFDDVQKAVAACRTSHYFVGYAELNAEIPHEATQWPVCWYPHLEPMPAKGQAYVNSR